MVFHPNKLLPADFSSLELSISSLNLSHPLFPLPLVIVVIHLISPQPEDTNNSSAPLKTQVYFVHSREGVIPSPVQVLSTNMKSIASQLSLIWLVLQATHSSARDGSLRGLSSSSTSSGVVARRMPTTSCPPRGQAQIWFGYHKINPDLTNMYQAELWVISPYTSHKSLPGFVWNAMPSDTPPEMFFLKGLDPSCYHFFTVGAGGKSSQKPDVLEAGMNRNADVNKPILDPKFLKVRSKENLVRFKTTTDEAITAINANFEAKLDPNDATKTLLKYNLLPHMDWYKLGHGWEQFNANGFMAGLLNKLGIKKSANIDTSMLFGWDKPVPQELFQAPTISSFADMKSIVLHSKECTTSPAELWVGYHTDSTNLVAPVDHAKIWVIQSTAAALPSDWKDLTPEMVPVGYEGDRNCAKFFSLSSGFGHGQYEGLVNENNDINTNLLGAVKVSFEIPDDLLEVIKTTTNPNIKANFQLLKSMTAFPQDWNAWDIGWREFNGNGYISGFLNYLAHLQSNLQEDQTGDQGFKPTGSFLDGWKKDIPIEFFETTFTTLKEMKAAVDADHKPDFASAAAASQALVAGKVDQQSMLDP